MGIIYHMSHKSAEKKPNDCLLAYRNNLKDFYLDRLDLRPALCLGNKLHSTANCLDLLLGALTDKSGTDNNRNSGDAALTEDLAVAGSQSINHWSRSGRSSRKVLLAVLTRDETPELVQVKNWAPLTVLQEVEVTVTDLTEVTWVVSVKVGTVMMLATSHTATTRVLAVLADTTVT